MYIWYAICENLCGILSAFLLSGVCLSVPLVVSSTLYSSAYSVTTCQKPSKYVPIVDDVENLCSIVVSRVVVSQFLILLF